MNLQFNKGQWDTRCSAILKTGRKTNSHGLLRQTCILDRERLLWPVERCASTAHILSGYMEVSWDSEGIDHTPYSKNTPLLHDQPSMKTFLVKNKVYSDH